jgi:hypothetical protein
MMTAGEKSVAGSDGDVKPPDCALAVAIPLSMEELSRDWIRDDTEFARVIVRKTFNALNAEEAWKRGYSILCDHVCDVVNSARALGVTVVKDARLADLRELFENFKVVSILAHGRFPLLEVEDVIVPDAFLETFAASRAGITAKSHPVISWLLGFPDVRNADSLEVLVRALKRQLDRTRRFYNRRRDEAPESDLPRAYELDETKGGLTRLLLHDAIPGALRSPPVIELRDGVHSFDAFVSTVPPAFDGTIDFVVCSALWFAEPLRRSRPLCADILCPKQLAFIGTRSRIYLATIQQLEHRATRFAHAQWAIHQYLLSMM